MMKPLFALLSLIFVSFAQAAPAPSILRAPDLEQLPNGITVAWFLGGQMPLLDLVFHCSGGYREDPTGKSGTFELMSALLDQGNAGKTSSEIAQEIGFLALEKYMQSDADNMHLGLHGFSDQAPKMAELLSRLVLKPDFPEKELKFWKKQTEEHWSEIYDDPGALATLVLERVLTAGTPYGRGSVLSLREFTTVARSDIQTIYQRIFAPSCATLLVIGQGKKDEIRKLLIEQFGTWKNPTPTSPSQSLPLKNYTDTRITPFAQKKFPLWIEGRTTEQSHFRLGWKAPHPREKDYYPAIVLNTIMGESFLSRMNKRLRDEMGLTYGTSSSISTYPDRAYWVLSFSTEAKNAARTLTEAKKILNELQTSPPTADEVQAAKDYLIGNFPLSAVSQTAIASRWMAGRIMGLPDSFLNEFATRVSAVSVAEVAASAKKYLKLTDATVVISGGGEKAKQSLKAGAISTVSLPAQTLR